MVTEQQRVRTAEEVLAVLSETPLRFLVETLRRGMDPQFDIGLEPIREGEVIIGEMTELEKILHAAAVQMVREASGIADKNNAMVDETGADEQGKPEFSNQVKVNKACFKAAKGLGDALYELLWASVKSRLGVSATEPAGIAIREGCVVVSRTWRVILRERFGQFLEEMDAL